jgi:hypothetical protein
LPTCTVPRSTGFTPTRNDDSRGRRCCVIEIREGQQTVTTRNSAESFEVFRQARAGRFRIYQMAVAKKNNAGWVFGLGWPRKENLQDTFPVH